MKQYKIFVNGRLFEISKSEERKNEIITILSGIYTDAEIIYQNTKGGRRIIAQKGKK